MEKSPIQESSGREIRDTDERRNEGDRKMHDERGRDTLMRNVPVETDNKPTRDADESRNEGDRKMHDERGRDTLMRNVPVETDNKPTRSNRTSSEVLREIQANINGEGVTMIEVGRSTVWEDVCAKLGQKGFSPNNRISAKFVNKEGESEEAVDLNGPKRELLRLAVKGANENSNIFFGPPRCRSLFANTTARKKGLYRFVGMLLAWSLAHGGPGGNFLSTTLYDSLAYGPCEKPPRLEDVADPDLKEKIIKIYNSKSQEEFENNLEDEEIKWILYAQGLAILRVFEKKDEIVGIILCHVLVDSTRSHFEEFKKGLETLGVLKAIQANPEQFRKEFTHQNVDAFDAKRMQDLFEINYFERGSNERHGQERTVAYWRKYLLDCQNDDAKVTLGEVLSFVTGADVPPSLGFGRIPVITFTNQTLPTADTCYPALYLPTVHGSYEEFKEIMDFSILNSPCFGQP